LIARVNDEGRHVARERLRVAVRTFDPFEQAIEKQFHAFEEATKTGLELDAVALDLNPLRETLFDDGGLRDGTWDVAFLNTDWIAESVETGSVVDLRPLMTDRPVPGYPEGWAPALLRLQDDGEHVWGLPYHDGPQCLIYRRDLLEDESERAAFRRAFGYDLAIPTTWEEFVDVARFFTRPGEDLYGTIFAAFPDGHNSVYDFCVQLWSRGGELIDAEGRPLLDSPQAAAALDFYRTAVADRGLTPPDLHEVDSVGSGELFAAGGVAMMANWFGFAAVLEQPDQPLKGKVGIAPLPRGRRGRRVALNVYWILAVAAGSERIDQAYDFVRFAATEPMDKITALEGATACRRSTWQDPEVNELVPFYKELDELHAEARELPSSPRFPALAHIIDGAVQRAITTADDTRLILADAQAEVDASGIRL
jgi:multiple sugar transport system substrate-binding protein